MGNPLAKSNCCSNQFGHNKKEVDIEDNIEEQGNKGPSLPEKRLQQAPLEERYKFPLQKPQPPKLENRTVEENTKELERIKYLAKICPKAPQLILKVVNSTTLTKGTLIKINAQGVEGSKRNKKDGITYFGCKKKSRSMNEESEPVEILNDYIIRNKEPESNERHRGRHFQIEYSIDSNSYKIRDLGIGFGAFVKIEHPLVLRDNNLLSMGSSFLIVNLDEDQKESLMYSNSQDLHDKLIEARLSRQSPFNSPVMGENNIRPQSTNDRKTGLSSSEITVKIFGGPSYGEVYHFSSTMPIIKIGRMPDCEIRIDDSLLSKYQGSIKYVPETGWTLFDGYNGKPSTNSNWLYLNDDFELYDGMIFKANHTLFQVIIENGPTQG